MRKILYTVFALALIGGTSALAVKQFKNYQSPITLVPATTSDSTFLQVGGQGGPHGGGGTDRGAQNELTIQVKQQVL
jgi:hypothetical protein